MINEVDSMVVKEKAHKSHSLLILLCLSILITACSAINSDVSNIPNDTKSIPSEIPSTKDIFEISLGTNWYSIYYHGNKVGWGKIKHKVVNKSDRTGYYMISRELRTKLQIHGYSHKIYSKDIYHFSITAPHKIIYLEYLHRMNDYIKEIRISKKHKGYRVYQTNRETKMIDHSDIKFSLTQVLNLQHWLYEKPKIGDTEYLYTFDPTATSIISNKVILDTIIQSPKNENGQKQYKCIIINKNDKNGYIIFDEKAQIIRMALTGNMEYKRASKTIAKKNTAISDLYIENIVPIKTTIGKLDNIKKIQLIIDTLSGSLLENASGQEVVKDSANNSYRVTLDPDDDNHQTAFYDEKLAFARINKDIFTNYPDLIHKLDSVIGSSNSVVEKVKVLLSFTDDIVEDDSGVLSPNIDYVLKHRKGDCSEHSLMFMALAKYENIPCRIVSGLAYLGDWGKGFGPHQWNEVILDNKWVPVDSTTRSMPIGPYYIRFPDNAEKQNKLWDHIKDMTIVVTEVMFKSSTSENTGIDTIKK